MGECFHFNISFEEIMDELGFYTIMLKVFLKSVTSLTKRKTSLTVFPWSFEELSVRKQKPQLTFFSLFIPLLYSTIAMCAPHSRPVGGGNAQFMLVYQDAKNIEEDEKTRSELPFKTRDLRS